MKKIGFAMLIIVTGVAFYLYKNKPKKKPSISEIQAKDIDNKLLHEKAAPWADPLITW